jgi:hypothetical protein
LKHWLAKPNFAQCKKQQTTAASTTPGTNREEVLW